MMHVPARSSTERVFIVVGLTATAIFAIAGCAEGGTSPAGQAPSTRSASATPSPDASAVGSYCRQYADATNDLGALEAGFAGPDGDVTLATIQQSLDPLLELDQSDPTLEAVAAGVDFIVTATDLQDFDSSEWDSIFGRADTACVNAGAFPIEQREGG